MTVRKLKPLVAGYYNKYYEMAERWGKAKRRKVPQIQVRICKHHMTRGYTTHNPPKIRIWVDEDERYATYLFIHELGHIVIGATTYHEESHGDRYLKAFYKLVKFFEEDQDYMIAREMEYALGRMTKK